VAICCIANKRRNKLLPDEAIRISEDDFICPEVGSWTEEKHRHVSIYATQFATGMKNSWDELVYVELPAGAGISRIRGTSRLIPGSPLRALSLKDPFDKYVFCEEDEERLEALKFRVRKYAPQANVAYISGNCNEVTGLILKEIPVGSKQRTVLSLCFADPFDISLKFNTLRKLSVRFIDFLVLLALHSDANRAYKRYVMEDANKVDDFLGSKTWRQRWRSAEASGVSFPKFLAEEFAFSMHTLDYIRTPIEKMKLVRSDEKNLPLYYIVPFSRNQLAYKFWDGALEYGTDQTKFRWD
jgi:three-Cys-motif partner protein